MLLPTSITDAAPWMSYPKYSDLGGTIKSTHNCAIFFYSTFD